MRKVDEKFVSCERCQGSLDNVRTDMKGELQIEDDSGDVSSVIVFRKHVENIYEGQWSDLPKYSDDRTSLLSDSMVRKRVGAQVYTQEDGTCMAQAIDLQD
jgi:hypothetical protein